MEKSELAIADFKSLGDLKRTAHKDANAALPEVAKQFEAIFLKAMMKSMRDSQHFIDESSPFRGKSEETFQDMLDGQYVSKMTENGGIGLAKMMVQQMQKSQMVPGKINDPSATAAALKPQPLYTATQNKQEAKQEGLIDQFVKNVLPYAKQAASVLGLDPKILLAQAALETGWGQFVIEDKTGKSSNNLFNIKADKQQGKDFVDVKTTEYIANTPIKMTASFKKYTTLEESFNDYVSLIKGTGRYKAALENTANPERYVKELGRAGYATDPDYAQKIMAIYKGDELKGAVERFDLNKGI